MDNPGASDSVNKKLEPPSHWLSLVLARLSSAGAESMLGGIVRLSAGITPNNNPAPAQVDRIGEVHVD